MPAAGSKSAGGARLVLVPADSQSKPEVAGAEDKRLIREGAHVMVGASDSSNINAIIQVIKQATKPIPLMIDIRAADQLTQRGVKHVFRLFVTSSILRRQGIEYMMEMCKDKGDTPKRAVFLHVSDLFAQVQAEKKLEWRRVCFTYRRSSTDCWWGGCTASWPSA